VTGHYDVLGVAPSAPPDEVRRAYLELARRHHPDRPGGDAELMRTINEAWAVLGDPGRRASYDLVLRQPAEPPRPAGPRPDDRWAADPRYDPTDDLTAEELRAWRLGFEPADLRDLADDRPIGGTVVLPRWAALLPPGMFAGSIVLFCLGVVMNAAPVVALSFAVLLLSIMAFLAAPFVALLLSRGGGRPPSS
jgi:hypothetical protein